MDVQSTGGRLSPLNINDPLLRSELFREIRHAQENPTKLDGDYWGVYTIQPADVLSPELIAYKVYGLDTLKWVILVATGLDDSREQIEAGTDIYLPTASYLRERIKHYTEMAETE